MLIPNHPDDERLSALASSDPEAAADAVLTEHVATCIRCTDTVAELGALRASLAELPDLQPHRPLQLLPPVADTPARADRVGGWARRFFAPMLTAGAALALVGLVGTTVPILGSGASGAAAQSEAAAATQPSESRPRPRWSDPERARGAGEGPAASAGSTDEQVAPGAERAERPRPRSPRSCNRCSPPKKLRRSRTAAAISCLQPATDDRPLWPMLLFAGVAMMIAAALLRWILAPRAG